MPKDFYWNYSKRYLFLQFLQPSNETLRPFRAEGKWVLALLITSFDAGGR
mgnify:CR=1 FL=1|jgi:hypothetical protein